MHLEEEDLSLLNTVVASSDPTSCKIKYEDFIGIMENIVNRGDLDVEGGSKLTPSQPLTDEVRGVLRSRIKSSEMTMRKSFQKFDLDHSGTIDRNEMQAVLQSLSIPYTQEQFEALFDLYDSNSDGQFQYFEFVKLIQQESDVELSNGALAVSIGSSVSNPGTEGAVGVRGGGNASSRRARDPRREQDELTTELIRKIDSRHSSMQNRFREMDVERTGFVSTADFLQVCGLWGVSISREDISSLDVTTCAPNHPKPGAHPSDVDIRYSEFTTLLKEASLSRDASNTLRSRIQDNGVTVWQMFQQFDTSHLGWVTQENMQAVLDSFDVKYSRHQFMNTANLYEETQGDNRFYYGDFCNIIGRKGPNFGTSM